VAVPLFEVLLPNFKTPPAAVEPATKVDVEAKVGLAIFLTVKFVRPPPLPVPRFEVLVPK